MKPGFFTYAERIGNRLTTYFIHVSQKQVSVITEKDLPYQISISNVSNVDRYVRRNGEKLQDPCENYIFYDALARLEKYLAPKEAVKTCQRTMSLPFQTN